MAQFPQLPLWTDAYLADTTHLNATEHGAYLLLLIAAWRSPDCALPNDDKALAAMARCTRHWSRVRAKVMAFWTLNPENGKYYQKRLSLEHNAATARARNAGHNARAKYLKNNNVGSAAASFWQSQPSATTTTTIKEEASLSSKGSNSAESGLHNFDANWKVHVRIDSPHWKACSERYRKQHRRWPPQDDAFGWYFPADWIKSQEAAE